ncbi:hypothetical protein MUY27_02315 [Mucilaginibacter sp. RS28]|uniref:Lipoprotein n=1 Tax=Mucilaginibacter straminoryzae TaxID=2932774 RepID=A0A9X1X0G7_9SPHI|nr:hypothetical protein [Mucilaginibacter straminoryzae]MCJ8208526.1 hypothetical protein [Mucilaginibacter straminoryzae]
MKGMIFILAALVVALTCCHQDPHNKFGGPSNQPQDTAAKKRDTSSVGTRTDR